MAASVASRAASLTLEPSNEGIEGEGLGELVTAGGRSSGGSGLLGLRGGDGGLDGGCSVAAGDRSGRGDSRGGRSRGGGGGGRAAGAEESWAGDGVVDGAGVGVEEDTGVGGSVELSSDNTLGGLATAASDLNVDT